MNYKRIYSSLIEKSKTRILEGYTETHHVLPKCLGGTDDSSNLVELTPEEHYVAHQLLVKIYPDNPRLINAAVMMIPARPSNKLYGWLKRKFSIVQSELQTGEKNSQFGTLWVYNDDLKLSKKIRKDETLEDGWKIGRKFIWDRTYNCKHCGIEFQRKGLENFCSDTCKKHYKSAAIRIIDENLDDMIKHYHGSRSIDKTLKNFGVKGERSGNKYFSDILKDRGLYVRGHKI